MAISVGLQLGVKSVQVVRDVGFPLHGLNESLNVCEYPVPYLQDRDDNRP